MLDFLTMFKSNQKISERYFISLLLCVVFLYCAVVGLQGLDLWDEGWCMTAYQQFFEHPLSAEYQFLYYNSILIGSVFHLIFGSLGIYAFRVLTAIFTTVLVFLLYKILSPIINRWAIFHGILIILLSKNYILVFHHNLTTSLLTTAAIYFLYKALVNHSKLSIFVAGAILGVNVFSRLPNVSLFSLALVLIPYTLYNKNVKDTLKMLFSAVGGAIVGVGLNLALIVIMGHWDIFIGNLSSGFSAATVEDSTHSMSNLLDVYISNYRTLLSCLPKIFFYPLFLYCFMKFMRGRILRMFFVSFFAILYFWEVWRGCHDIYAIYTAVYIIMVVYLLLRPNPQETYLIIMAFLVMLFLPFGSDYGIGNMGPSCIWLGVPLAVGLMYKLILKYKEELGSGWRGIKLFILIFIIAFSGKNIKKTIEVGCHLDPGLRILKTSKMHAPLANTFTDKYKCELFDELLVNLDKYVDEGDYLLSWQNASMVHYLSHTYPYLNNAIPWAYDSNNLERYFKKAEENNPILPVIVCNKSTLPNLFKYDKDWNNENATNQWAFNSKKIKLFNNFVKKNHYCTVWENDVFRIMIPAPNPPLIEVLP